jgi:uncharacterized protein (TIGR00730 family)
MYQSIKAITVYASSGSQIAPIYFEAAKELGKLLAGNQITCINGGGNRGLMIVLSDSALSNGGKVIGIIPQFMVDEDWCHSALTERIVTPDMHTRKRLMAQKSDACIALPGGTGTMEELLEVITWRQLGLYSHPIVILNINNFYDDLLAMLDKAQKENFIYYKPDALWMVAQSPEEALHLVLNHPL